MITTKTALIYTMTGVAAVTAISSLVGTLITKLIRRLKVCKICMRPIKKSVSQREKMF